MDKKLARIRRAKRARAHIRRLGIPRLSVFRSGRHIYAQVIETNSGNVLATASTVQKAISSGLESTKNKAAAAAVGKVLAEKAVAAGVSEVAFDRSGYKYHGCVKELADAAREHGLKF